MPVATEWFDHRSSESFLVTCNATPLALQRIGPVPQGFIWYLERVSVHVNTHTGIPNIFSTSSDTPELVNMTDRQDTGITAANDFQRDYSNPILVKPGHWLLIAVNGGTIANGDTVGITVQIAWCITNPTSAYGSLNPREMLGLAEQERTEDMQRKQAVVVGGSGWNAGVYLPDDMAANGFDPWAGRAQGTPTDDPAVMEDPLPGTYVGGNNLGAPHPTPPYDGRILPDHSVESTS